MKITHLAFSTAAAAAMLITGSPAAFAQLPTTKVLTVDVAQTIAQEAMTKCRENGYKVTVTVVDSANMLKAFLRDDGAPRATIEIGRRKINSVMAFGAPSGPPANLPAGAPVPPPLLPDMINLQGGLPIKVGNDLIGAVSVSGAPGGDKDAACASYALEKVAGKLK
jgi:uncharacterized protein GlcG (DUF336 family)